MGLFGNRAARAARKAEKAEATAAAVPDRKPSRRERRNQEKVAKAQIAALKAQEKASLKVAEKAGREKFSVAAVKKYLGVARVLAPVLLPLIYRAATIARSQLDARRAQRLGIGVEQLGDYAGHGAKLTARIGSAEQSTEAVAAANGDAETAKFTAATRARLASLETAVRAAEQMPASQRRTAHTAIAKELTGIEADLLARLGIK